MVLCPAKSSGINGITSKCRGQSDQPSGHHPVIMDSHHEPHIQTVVTLNMPLVSLHRNDERTSNLTWDAT